MFSTNGPCGGEITPSPNSNKNFSAKNCSAKKLSSLARTSMYKEMSKKPKVWDQKSKELKKNNRTAHIILSISAAGLQIPSLANIPRRAVSQKNWQRLI